jgi:hypothetical protein
MRPQANNAGIRWDSHKFAIYVIIIFEGIDPVGLALLTLTAYSPPSRSYGCILVQVSSGTSNMGACPQCDALVSVLPRSGSYDALHREEFTISHTFGRSHRRPDGLTLLPLLDRIVSFCLQATEQLGASFHRHTSHLYPSFGHDRLFE